LIRAPLTALQYRHIDIRNNEEYQPDINNGNGKGKTTDGTTPISQLLRANMNGLLIEGRIESVGEPRSVNLRTGSPGQVADAIISDGTGTIKLPLWNDQINSICHGDNITLDKGYTKEYRGEIILCVSKNGRLTKH